MKAQTVRLRMASAVLLVALAPFVAKAATYYSAATGEWQDNTTWTTSDGTDFPKSGDTAYVRLGHTVTITAANGAGLSILRVGDSTTTSQLTILGNLGFSTEFSVGWRSGGGVYRRGSVVQESGTVSSGGASIAVAHSDADSIGSYDLQGGSINLTSTSAGFLIVGREGTGTFSQSGTSTVTLARTTSTAFIIGAVSGSSGTYTMTGGTLNVLGQNSNIGSASTGTMTISGTAQANLKDVILGAAAGGTGTLNLNGGTLRLTSLTKGASANTQTFNFSGGTLAPYNADAMIGSATASNNITTTLAGTGATISSSDKDGTGRTVSIWSKLTGEGAITFSGNGTNIVIAADSDYTGNTTVNGGTVVWSNAVLSAGADLLCTNSPTIGLSYDVTNTIRRLYINNKAQAVGVYKTGNAPAGMTIIGNGALEVTDTVPPKGTVLIVN